MKSKTLIILGLTILLTFALNVSAAKKIYYTDLSSILKDSWAAIGKSTMINNMKIVQEIKSKQSYLAQDEAGNKVVLGLTGKISISSEFAKIKRIEVGTVYAVGFKVTKISSDKIVYGNVEAIGFPHEVPSSPAQKQKETEAKPSGVYEEKKELRQSQPVAQGPAKKTDEPKPAEPPKALGKEVQPSTVENPVTKPGISGPAPSPEKKVQPIQATKAGEPQKSAGEGRTTSEKRGTLMGDIFLLLPLIIGALIGGLTYGLKTNLFIEWIKTFDTWVINKRNALREEVGKGKIKKYWLIPILWILNGIIKLSEKIPNEGIRCGVKSAAYLYLLEIVVVVTFYAVLIIVVVIIAAILLWIIGVIYNIYESSKRPESDYGHVLKEKDKSDKSGLVSIHCHCGKALEISVQDESSVYPERCPSCECEYVVKEGKDPLRIRIGQLPDCEALTDYDIKNLQDTYYHDLQVQGEMALIRGNPEQAAVLFQKAANLRPNEAEARIRLCKARVRFEPDINAIFKELDQAEMLLSTDVSTKPMNKFDGKDEIHFIRGAGYFILNDIQKTTEHLQNALNINPDHMEARKLLDMVKQKGEKTG